MDTGKKTRGNRRMRRFLENRWFMLLLRVVLGGIFLYAGIMKIGNSQAFADSIATFKILPDQIISIIALGLPPFEVLLGLMLLVGWKARTALLGITALAVVFGITLGQAIARGLSVDCGCFGSGEPSAVKTWLSLGRACLLFLAGAWLYFSIKLKSSESATQFHQHKRFRIE